MLFRSSLNLRNTPELRFILDESIEYGVNMSKLIDDVMMKDAKTSQPDQEEKSGDGREE